MIIIRFSRKYINCILNVIFFLFKNNLNLFRYILKSNQRDIYIIIYTRNIDKAKDLDYLSPYLFIYDIL